MYPNSSTFLFAYERATFILETEVYIGQFQLHVKSINLFYCSTQNDGFRVFI